VIDAPKGIGVDQRFPMASISKPIAIDTAKSAKPFQPFALNTVKNKRAHAMKNGL
jgi:hypothetical protein